MRWLPTPRRIIAATATTVIVVWAVYLGYSVTATALDTELIHDPLRQALVAGLVTATILVGIAAGCRALWRRLSAQLAQDAARPPDTGLETGALAAAASIAHELRQR